MGHFQGAHGLCRSGHAKPEQRAGNDAEEYPEGEVTLEEAQWRPGLLAGHFALSGHLEPYLFFL